MALLREAPGHRFTRLSLPWAATALGWTMAKVSAGRGHALTGTILIVSHGDGACRRMRRIAAVTTMSAR